MCLFSCMNIPPSIPCEKTRKLFSFPTVGIVSRRFRTQSVVKLKPYMLVKSSLHMPLLVVWFTENPLGSHRFKSITVLSFLLKLLVFHYKFLIDLITKLLPSKLLPLQVQLKFSFLFNSMMSGIQVPIMSPENNLLSVCRFLYQMWL